MGSVQEEQQSWTRHWEVLERVGLPDFTPDVLWQADVLHRAGAHKQQQSQLQNNHQRSINAGQDRQGPSGSSGRDGGGGSGGGQYPVSQSYPLPARFAVAAAVRQNSPGGSRGNSSGGGGGPLNLHPRLRPGHAKQPANRSRQPRVPLDSALNLQLVDNPELYGPYQVQMQELTLSPSTPRMPVAAASGGGALYDSSNGGVYRRDDGEEFDGVVVSSTLPSLAQSPSGGGGGGGAGTAAARADDDGSNGGGDEASSRGPCVVSFRIALPAVPTPPMNRSGSGVAATQSAAVPSSLLRSSSGRAAITAAAANGGGSGSCVTWSPAFQQDQGSTTDEFSAEPLQRQQQQVQLLASLSVPPPPPPPQQQHQQQQQQLQQQTLTWRPAPGTGGSGGLTARMPPSRKPSTDVSYTYSTSSYSHMQHPYYPLQQCQPTRTSLSGEYSSVPRYASSAQWTISAAAASASASAAVAPTPRERYKGILERAGRAAAHGHHERRRTGALAAAAGSQHLRQGKAAGSESDSENDRDTDFNGGGGDGGGGGGSRSASPMTGGGICRWGGRWIKPLTGLNTTEAASAREGKAVAGDDASAASVDGRQPATMEAGAPPPPPAAERGQGQGQCQSQRNESTARRLGVADRAVWKLRRALDELARFSCLNARHGAMEEESVLSQVDARILALRKYDRIELGPDGRRTSVLPPPPPVFPLEAALEYLAAAQSGVAGLEELEDVVSSMRKKLQVIVGHDTEDLRRAAAEALAEAGPGWVSEPSTASETGGAQVPYPVRRPSSSFTVGGANWIPNPNSPFQNYQPPSQVNGTEPLSSRLSYNGLRVPSATTTVSSQDPTIATATGFGNAIPGNYQSSPHPSYSGGAAAAPPSPSWNNASPIRKASIASASSAAQAAAGPGLDQAWYLLESLVIQLQDSHASRIDMMDAFDKRASTDSGGTSGLGRGGGAAAALLAAAAGAHGAVHNRHQRRGRRGGGVERLARLVNVVDANGATNGMAEVKEAAAEAAVSSNAVRAAVAATLEPKHTEQALYFLAKLSLMLQQDPRLPPDAGFLVTAGVDLLLGEFSWLLALLRCTSGAGSPHLVVLAAALRAYEMQRSYTTTLMAVAERLEQAAEEAMDRAALVERQLAATQTALQRANHDVLDMENNVRDMERDMRSIKARNQLLEETVADLEGNLEVVEEAHAARGVTLQQAERFAGMMFAEHLGRVRCRSKRIQVASEGDCSDPRAIPPLLEPTSNQYYPITPCVSSRNIGGNGGGAAPGRKGAGGSPLRSGSRKQLSKARGGSFRKGGLSRAASRREKRDGHDGGDATEAAAAAAAAVAAAALAAARAAVDASEDDTDHGGLDSGGEGFDLVSEFRWGDGENGKIRDSTSSASRLSVLKRSGQRTVSWVDRTPRRYDSLDVVHHMHGGNADGRISPVLPAAAAAASGEDDGNGSDSHGTSGGTPRERDESPRSGAEGDGGNACTETGRGRRSPTSRRRTRKKNRESSDRTKRQAEPQQQRQQQQQQQRQQQQQQQQQQEVQQAPPTRPSGTQPPDPQQPQPPPQPPHEQITLAEQQPLQQMLQQQDQQHQGGQQGVENVEYWTQTGSVEEGLGEEGLLGDGIGEAVGRTAEEMLQDAELEQAARDMFSDVFERKHL